MSNSYKYLLKIFDNKTPISISILSNLNKLMNLICNHIKDENKFHENEIILKDLEKVIQKLYSFSVINLYELIEPTFRGSQFLEIIFLRISLFWIYDCKKNENQMKLYSNLSQMKIHNFIGIELDSNYLKEKVIFDYNIHEFIELVNNFEIQSIEWNLDEIMEKNKEDKKGTPKDLLLLIFYKFLKLIHEVHSNDLYIKNYTTHVNIDKIEKLVITKEFIFDFSFIICSLQKRFDVYDRFNLKHTKKVEIKKNTKKNIEQSRIKILKIENDALKSNSQQICEEITRKYLDFIVKPSQCARFLRKSTYNDIKNSREVYSNNLTVESVVNEFEDDIELEKLTIDQEVSTTFTVLIQDDFFKYKDEVLNKFLQELFFLSYSKEKLFNLKEIFQKIYYNYDLTKFNERMFNDLKNEISHNPIIIQDHNHFNLFYKNEKYVLNDILSCIIIYISINYDNQSFRTYYKTLIQNN